MTKPESKALSVAAHVEQALRVLEQWGVLLLRDPKLPNLVGMIAGEPVRGSWWSHPKAGEIFKVVGKLDDHPDVISTKLISGKVTVVHRSRWALLIAIGRSREAWQLEGLTAEDRILLERVNEEERVLATGKSAKVLEQRLLVAASEVHTDSGSHALELTTWKAFARQVGMPLPRLSPARARSEMENQIAAMNQQFEADGRLPWLRSTRRRP